MDARLTLRILRRDHYTCQRRDSTGRKCLEPARFVALRNGEPEARCTAHNEIGVPRPCP